MIVPQLSLAYIHCKHLMVDEGLIFEPGCDINIVCVIVTASVR